MDQPGADLSDRGDTVFALASGAGRAAIAVMRITGPKSGAVLDQMCRKRPAARRASVRTLRDASGRVLDRALVLWLPGPDSFTGEDSAELHVHGGPAVLQDVAAALVDAGLRPAERGEFTRRAFANGRIDLLEAEAIADLIEAETSAQRDQALGQMEGRLSRLVAEWRSRLVSLLAHQEALIDFPDEDLPDDAEQAMLREGRSLLEAMTRHLDDDRRGERLREGIAIAVLGLPNAGKSSLVNALTERDVAIVADLPGTTRDVLEARIVIAGTPVTLLDTAGLREASDAVEAEGVRRALHRAAAADIVMAVSSPDDGECFLVPPHPRVIKVGTKADLQAPRWPVDVVVSAHTGEGIDALREVLAAAVRTLAHAGTPAPLTRARHRAALKEAAESLERALSAELPELRGEDLRLAMRALGRITGAVGVEEILDSVFRQFCIGK